MSFRIVCSQERDSLLGSVDHYLSPALVNTEFLWLRINCVSMIVFALELGLPQLPSEYLLLLGECELLIRCSTLL